MFLNKNELTDLTGYKLYSKQVQWLRNRGYKHEIGCDGRPRVLKIYIEKILGSGDKQSKSSQQIPNFDALNRVCNGL